MCVSEHALATKPRFEPAVWGRFSVLLLSAFCARGTGQAMLVQRHGATDASAWRELIETEVQEHAYLCFYR